MVLRADAGEHEELRGVERPAAQDDLPPAVERNQLVPPTILDGGGGLRVGLVDVFAREAADARRAETGLLPPDPAQILGLLQHDLGHADPRQEVEAPAAYRVGAQIEQARPRAGALAGGRDRARNTGEAFGA